ncbi:GNAT family N-acetyltransferase [Thioclava sp.]|uniref:GNAT family N-acetyltransferase n=1 Tax=Thioclava sp. TaxID=1933450 RepID=UPI003AA8BDFB
MNHLRAPFEVEGPRLRLRLVSPEDATYIHGLRIDPAYNTHLSSVTGSAEDQRRWIEAYKAREAAGDEYYYVIERRDNGQRCGVVRLYDIKVDQFTWGSWILDANKPPKAALESAFLLYEIGFGDLGLNRAVFDVRSDNEHTQAFHRRLGATETGSDDVNLYFVYPRARHEADRERHIAVLEGKE